MAESVVNQWCVEGCVEVVVVVGCEGFWGLVVGCGDLVFSWDDGDGAGCVDGVFDFFVVVGGVDNTFDVAVANVECSCDGWCGHCVVSFLVIFVCSLAGFSG